MAGAQRREGNADRIWDVRKPSDKDGPDDNRPRTRAHPHKFAPEPSITGLYETFLGPFLSGIVVSFCSGIDTSA